MPTRLPLPVFCFLRPAEPAVGYLVFGDNGYYFDYDYIYCACLLLFGLRLWLRELYCVIAVTVY